MSVLAIEGLTKRFGALVVTDGVSLTVEPGEVHALIGPNGAGKTTLIKQIAGAVAPDAGRVRLDGEDVTALPEHARAARGLARTFQITAVFPQFTARENVALAAQAKAPRRLWPFSVAARDAGLNAAADAALETVGLAGRAGELAGRLAHGEQRGLEVAMALVQRPRLLLLDEPMAGAGRDETDRLIATLARLKGRVPMLLIEHDMGAVFALADRVSVLVAGRIVATGAPEAIRADPAVRAAYLGTEAA
ncbi:MAG: ABC transporter ATP-binding protein [Rhodobacteraceae bacterium]|nr:MAG: ABC transporter ATP-binding protein [Paracoccaceae bacterium]